MTCVFSCGPKSTEGPCRVWRYKRQGVLEKACGQDSKAFMA